MESQARGKAGLVLFVNLPTPISLIPFPAGRERDDNLLTSRDTHHPVVKRDPVVLKAFDFPGYPARRK